MPDSDRPSFADFGRVEPTSVIPGSLSGFAVDATSVAGFGGLEVLVSTLRPDGTGRVAIDDPEAAIALVGDVPDGVAVVDVARSGRRAEIVVAPGESDTDPVALALRALAELVAETARTHEELSATRSQLDRERTRNKHGVAQLTQSSQYRIGQAVIDVARRPTRLPVLFRTLREIWSGRSKPAPIPLPSADDAPRLSVEVSSILDEFSHHCFAPEARLEAIGRSGWEKQVTDSDLVLIESAWRGNAGRWSYTLTQFDDKGADLRSVLDTARGARVPSVFWNKEDPVSYDTFLPVARHFDHVFTTDADVVPRYREALGHDRVHALPFAAQPRIHNPIGRPRGDAMPAEVAFAGSWRGDKYTRRGGDFDVLLRPALDRGVLKIYDRFADRPESEGLGFPDPFRSAVVGSLTYEETVAAYRASAAFMNVNSVHESPTMFSRRVFELLACATPVISTPAHGISEMLGDLVLVTESPATTESLIDWVVNEHDARDRHAHLGYRAVHGAHTYEARFATILDQVGVAADRPSRRVSVICVTNRRGQIDHVVDTYLRQTHEDRELIFVANSNDFTPDDLDGVRRRVPGSTVLQIDESATLGECLNEARRQANGAYVAKIDDDDHYGDEYLADLMLAFGYVDAAVVGKQTYYAHLESRDETVLRFPGKEFTDAPRVCGGTIVADRSLTDDIDFEKLPRGTDTAFLNAVRGRGLRVFSADRYNFVQVRRSDPDSHTWGLDEEDFLKATIPVGSGLAGDAVFF